MSTLKRSERNCIIEDYHNGIIHPNYEVIQTKTKGRYTVRKRKVPLTEEQLATLTGNSADNDAGNDNDAAGEQQPITKRSITDGNLATDGNSRQLALPGCCIAGSDRDRHAIADLQNQLNQQMLYRLNELTNKVVKLKTWKKKIKQELYSDEQDNLAAQCQDPTQDNSCQEQENSCQAPTQGNLRCQEPTTEPEQGNLRCQEQTDDNLYCPDEGHEYLNKIPQEYVQDNTMQEYVQPRYFNRSLIDYSKFGF